MHDKFDLFSGITHFGVRMLKILVIFDVATALKYHFQHARRPSSVQEGSFVNVCSPRCQLFIKILKETHDGSIDRLHVSTREVQQLGAVAA